MIRILTDSASDINTPHRPEIIVLPMTVTFGEIQYKDGVDLTHHQFYERLIESDTLPVTSQLTPFDFQEAFRAATSAGDTVVAITLSSKLSGTYQSACIAAREFPGQVFVVDSENAAIGEAILVHRAVQLIDQSCDAATIASRLDAEKKSIHLVALLDTLEYLQRGGRLSKSAAIVGGLLSIKPVIAVKDGEVCVLGKARGSRNGNNLLIQEIEKTAGIDFSRPYCLGYTGLNDTLLQKYISDSRALWGGRTDTLPISTIGGTIGTHVGPGAIAVAFFRNDTPERS